MYSMFPRAYTLGNIWLQTTATVSTLIWSHSKILILIMINICRRELRLN